jgi:hypothetical protein
MKKYILVKVTDYNDGEYDFTAFGTFDSNYVVEIPECDFQEISWKASRLGMKLVEFVDCPKLLVEQWRREIEAERKEHEEIRRKQKEKSAIKAVERAKKREEKEKRQLAQRLKEAEELLAKHKKTEISGPYWTNANE